MQHGDIGIIGPHDLLVCFSKSGATEEIIRLVPFAKVGCLAHMCEGKACACKLLQCLLRSWHGGVQVQWQLAVLQPRPARAPLQAKGARLVSITSVPGSPLEEVSGCEGFYRAGRAGLDLLGVALSSTPHSSLPFLRCRAAQQPSPHSTVAHLRSPRGAPATQVDALAAPL